MSRSVEILLSARDQASASIKKVTDALKAENLAVAEAKRLFEATLTPQEKFVRGQRQLHMAMMSGKLGLLEYTRALEQLNRGLERTGQSDRAYLARVRYNSNLMAAQTAQASAAAAASRRAQIQGVAGALNFTDPTFNPFYFDPNQRQGMLARARGRMGRFFGGAGAMLGGALPAIGAGMAIGGSWNQYMNRDLAESRLAAVLRATGRTDVTLGGVRDYAAARSRQTMFGGDDIVSAAATLAPFQHIKGETFHQTLKAAQDLATVMGTDVTSAAYKLGKAMENPQTLLASLHQGGVVFEESLKKQIKALAEAGDYQQAHAMILDEVARRAGGAAEIAGKSAAGQWSQLKSAIGEVAEVIGEKLLPVVTFLRDQMQGLAGTPTPGQDHHVNKPLLGRALGAASNAGTSSKTLREQLNDIVARRDQLRAEAAGVNAQLQDPGLFDGIPFLRNIFGSIRGHNLAAQHSEKVGAIDRLNDAEQILIRRLRAEQALDATRTGGGGAVARALGVPSLIDGISSAVGAIPGQARSWRDWANRRGEEIRPGIRSFINDAREFEQFRNRFRSPEEQRAQAMRQLDQFSKWLTPEQAAFARKRIDDDFERQSQQKKQRPRAHSDSLQAIESRFLTRGRSVSPEVEEARKLNNAMKQANKLLASIDRRVKARPKVINKF